MAAATHKRKPVDNAVCENHDHFKAKFKGGKRQRHTCYQCMSTDLASLNSNPSLTRWDVARIMVALTRSYVCSICLLGHEGDTITPKAVPKVAHCKKHSVFNAQRICIRHKKRWTRCSSCLYDLRAATSFCRICNKIFHKQCMCVHGPVDFANAASQIHEQQPQDQIDLKQKLMADLFECARQLEETKTISDPEEKSRAVHEIWAAFYVDTSSLRTVFQLRADRMLQERTEEDDAVSALMAMRNG
jgi:hypothetical protein